MFDLIRSFFEQIGTYFTNIWNFFQTVFSYLSLFFRMAKAGLEFWVNLLGMLPVIFIGFGIATVTVLIIYQILGRTSGGD